MKKKIWRFIFKVIGKGPICITDGHLPYQSKNLWVWEEMRGGKKSTVTFNKISCRRHYCPWEKYVEVKKENDFPPLS